MLGGLVALRLMPMPSRRARYTSRGSAPICWRCGSQRSPAHPDWTRNRWRGWTHTCPDVTSLAALSSPSGVADVAKEGLRPADAMVIVDFWDRQRRFGVHP